MRVLFLGTPLFALPTLQRLLQSSHSVVAVLTQPDRPQGRRQTVQSSPVKGAARAAGVSVIEPEDLAATAFLRTIQQRSPDCAIVVAYGRLLPLKLLEVFPHGVFNLHASLLPRYRGAAPIQWAILSGETETGVTLFQIDEQLDHGPIALQAKIPILPEDTAVTLAAKLSQEGAALVIKLLDQLEKGKPDLQPQDEKLATYAPRLSKADGKMDWRLKADQIHNKIRALQPWPGTVTQLEKQSIRLLESRIISAQSAAAPPGSILKADSKVGLHVQTGQGVLEILRLQAEGGKPLTAAEFLRGHPILPGACFGV